MELDPERAAGVVDDAFQGAVGQMHQGICDVCSRTNWLTIEPPFVCRGCFEPEVWFCAWADEEGLSADQKEAVRRESEVLGVSGE